MRSTALTALKVVLWYVAAFHLFVGLSTNLSPGLTELVARLYGATTEWEPQFAYALKPIGAYMLAIGVMAAAAARDPLRHAPVIYALALLFVVRALHRAVLAEEIHHLFAITPERSLTNLVVMAAHAVVLLALHRAATRAAGQRAA